MKDGPPSRVFLGKPENTSESWDVQTFFSLLGNLSRECTKTTSFSQLTTSYFFQVVTWSNTPTQTSLPSFLPSSAVWEMQIKKKKKLQKKTKTDIGQKRKGESERRRSRNKRKSIFDFSSTPLFLFHFIIIIIFTFSHAVNKSYSENNFHFLPICFSPSDIIIILPFHSAKSLFCLSKNRKNKKITPNQLCTASETQNNKQ